MGEGLNKSLSKNLCEMQYPIYPNTKIENIPKDITEIKLVRPIPTKKLTKLINKYKPQKIYAAQSTINRFSEKTKKILENHEITITKTKKMGRALEIDIKTIQEIIELHNDEQPYREIEKLTKIPKSTIHYLVKYANREKIKLGKNILYLE